MTNWNRVQPFQFYDYTPKRTGSYSYPSCYVITGAANTKGVYEEAIASTVQKSFGIMLTVGYGSGANDYLVDIAIGGSGSEQVIIPNLLVSRKAAFDNGGFFNIIIPMNISSGTRISVRGQSTGASKTLIVGIHVLYGEYNKGFSKVVSYGENTSDSGGTSVDSGGTAHTYGSYQEITSSLNEDIKGFFVCIGNQVNTARTYAEWLMDIAIGGSGSEQVIISNLYMGSNGSSMINPMVFPFIPMNILSGTRISVRSMCNLIDATDRLFDLTFYGVL